MDPNDRPTQGGPVCYLGDPATANDMPTGLARFTCASSWLSQWSIDDSNADGVRHMGRISTVPVLVIENGADNGCPATHPRDMFEASAAQDKTLHVVRHARHYYDGQPDKLQEACLVVLQWLKARSLVDITIPTPANAAAPHLPAGTAAATATHQVRDPGQDLETLRSRYNGAAAMHINGINHLALVSSDMKRTCEFYGGVLGLRLSKTIALPEGGQHFFFDLHDGNSLAFFFFPDAKPSLPSVSAPSQEQMLREGKHPSAMGSMNHVAFNVPASKLGEYRKRLKASPLSSFVSPVLFHADTPEGFAFQKDDPLISWESVYFFGPDGELLELTSQARAYPAESAGTHVVHMPKPALWCSALSDLDTDE